LDAFHPLSCVFLAKEPNNVGTLTWVNVQPRVKVKKKVQSENGPKRKAKTWNKEIMLRKCFNIHISSE